MAQRKKGLIARMLEGKERSEEYARSTLPTNRWQLFFDIFKGNFWKLVKINILMLIFFIPVIAVIVFALMYDSTMGHVFPFGANLGVGYPAVPNMQGVSEQLAFQRDLLIYGLLFVASLIAAVGLAGGMYVVRNMVWTEGIFVANDFWKGVKLNYKNALQSALFFCTVFLLCKSMINFSEFSKQGTGLSKFHRVLLNISSWSSWIFIFLGAMMSFWMIALSVNYKMGFFLLLRNAFLLSIATIPQTLFFGALALLPYCLILLGNVMGLFLILGIFVILLFGFSWTLLLWLDFAQWVFDKYINPKISGAKVGRGIYSKDGSAQEGDDSAASLEYQRLLLSHGRSRLVARPIKPIDDSLQVYELPQAFTREDLKKLRESKQNIAEDTELYAEEHKNDLRYVEYNKQFDERERAIQEEDMKGKKKRAKKPPRILNDNKDEE